MRESKAFAQRTLLSKKDRTVRKYFLVYEGSDTEKIYFDAVDKAKNQIGINPLIELIPVFRSYSEEGWSNPKKILDRIIRDIEENRTGIISYETIINRIIAYLSEEKPQYISNQSSKIIWNTLVYICEKEMGQSITDNVEDIEKNCDFLISKLQEKLQLRNIIADISEIIKNGEITYSEEIDKICLIVDRDRDSFVSNEKNDQYSYVLKKCIENKFGLYVTNPCFEFWLLLHFDEVINLDEDKLLNNEKVTAKRRYAEDELRKLLCGYKKASYNAGILMNYIDKAIENEKKFCEDIGKLKDCVGSNIGKLITEMRESK